jgi:hypothetical protein
MTNANRTPLIHSRLDPVSQRRVVEAVVAEARRLRAEAIRNLLRQAVGFIYRSPGAIAQLIRRTARGSSQREKKLPRGNSVAGTCRGVCHE